MTGGRLKALAKADLLVDAAVKGLEALCHAHSVPESHGVGHALRVLHHVDQALARGRPLPEGRTQAVRLAALLHDADDRKLFGSKAENAREIMTHIGSANGNSVPEAALAAPELLWPRWADRLEATGIIGIIRCWQFNNETGAPLVLPDTPRPRSEEEVWQFASSERFERYQTSGGKSRSMLDHYYDKLLRVACPPMEVVQNAYLEEEMANRSKPLVDICLAYGESGSLPLNDDIIEQMKASLPFY
ncbi:unnamed protein product [Effrenium voratum]|nr:unnamed protein product [Effrenium voratum]